MHKQFVMLLLPTFLQAAIKIIGGSLDSISNVPYQLSLRLLGRHICGAALLSNKVAISAAHCFQIEGSYSIKAGVSNLNEPGTIVHIKIALIHPQFDKQTVDYDIALMFLSKPLKFSDKIQPVALPQTNVKEGMIGKVSGWGAISTSTKTIVTSQLQSVEVPVVDFKRCNNIYFNKITKRMFCAGLENGGKDSCAGDSGGPFVSNGMLFGIVSGGFDCAQPNYPGIYTNVQVLRNFIKINTGL